MYLMIPILERMTTDHCLDIHGQTKLRSEGVTWNQRKSRTARSACGPGHKRGPLPYYGSLCFIHGGQSRSRGNTPRPSAAHTLSFLGDRTFSHLSLGVLPKPFIRTVSKTRQNRKVSCPPSLNGIRCLDGRRAKWFCW